MHRSDNPLIAHSVWLYGKDPPQSWLGSTLDCLSWSMIQAQHSIPNHLPHTLSQAYANIKTKQGCPHPFLRAPLHFESVTAIGAVAPALDEWHLMGASATPAAVISPALPTGINVKNKSCMADTARMHLSSH